MLSVIPYILTKYAVIERILEFVSGYEQMEGAFLNFIKETDGELPYGVTLFTTIERAAEEGQNPQCQKIVSSAREIISSVMSQFRTTQVPGFFARARDAIDNVLFRYGFGSGISAESAADLREMLGDELFESFVGLFKVICREQSQSHAASSPLTAGRH